MAKKEELEAQIKELKKQNEDLRLESEAQDDKIKETMEVMNRQIETLKKDLEGATGPSQLMDENVKLREELETLIRENNKGKIDFDELPDHVTIIPRMNIHFWALVESGSSPMKILSKVDKKETGQKRAQKMKNAQVEFISLKRPNSPDHQMTKHYQIPRDLAIEYIEAGQAFLNERAYEDFMQFPEVHQAGRRLVPIDKEEDPGIGSTEDFLTDL